jgi:hypothetical protein
MQRLQCLPHDLDDHDISRIIRELCSEQLLRIASGAGLALVCMSHWQLMNDQQARPRVCLESGSSAVHESFLQPLEHRSCRHWVDLSE